jgi:hypothetical protein
MKTFKDYISEAKTIKAYHGTHKRNISRIKRDGIQPSPDAKKGNRQYNAVFLAKEKNIAFAYAAVSGMGGEINSFKSNNVKRTKEEDRVVFEVTIDPSVHKIKWETKGDFAEIAIEGGIDPKYIKQIKFSFDD